MDKTASFGSSTRLLVQQTLSLFQERLKYLVEGREECWGYAIFWQAFKDNYQQLYLSFGDCYCQQSQVLNTGQGISNINPDSELIIASAARLFVLGEDIVGGTFDTGTFMWLAGNNALQMNGSMRNKEVHLYGMKTLVCIATSWGVVELGSLDVLKEDWGLVILAKSLFTPETDATIIENHLHQVQPFNHQDLSLLDLRAPSTSTMEDTPKKNSEMKKNTITHQINPKYKYTERERREKLNQRFYALRSVVPYVSKMDKPSLLADAVTYIGELKSKIETLTKKAESLHLTVDDSVPMTRNNSSNCMVTESHVEVKIVGSRAVIRVQSPDTNHPVARLINAMKNLEISVLHASASNISNMMIQDVLAQIPEGFPNDVGVLRTMIMKNLQDFDDY